MKNALEDKILCIHNSAAKGQIKKKFRELMNTT